MSRPPVTEEELRARLRAAQAIPDRAERSPAVKKARLAIIAFENRSTLGFSERTKLQGRG